jgi:hypothetical protein
MLASAQTSRSQVSGRCVAFGRVCRRSFAARDAIVDAPNCIGQPPRHGAEPNATMRRLVVRLRQIGWKSCSQRSPQIRGAAPHGSPPGRLSAQLTQPTEKILPTNISRIPPIKGKRQCDSGSLTVPERLMISEDLMIPEDLQSAPRGRRISPPRLSGSVICGACADRREAIPYRSRPAMF